MREGLNAEQFSATSGLPTLEENEVATQQLLSCALSQSAGPACNGATFDSCSRKFRKALDSPRLQASLQ